VITKLSLCLTVADTSNLTVVLDIDHWIPSNIFKSISKVLGLKKLKIFFSVQFVIVIVCSM
jgi:hypothetical protein